MKQFWAFTITLHLFSLLIPMRGEFIFYSASSLAKIFQNFFYFSIQRLIHSDVEDRSICLEWNVKTNIILIIFLN